MYTLKYSVYFIIIIDVVCVRDDQLQCQDDRANLLSAAMKIDQVRQEVNA